MVKPCNRHLLVELIVEEETETKLILPEDFAKEGESPYSCCKVLALANDCTFPVPAITGDTIVVDTHMIKEIEVSGEVFHLVLENYILCRVEESE